MDIPERLVVPEHIRKVLANPDAQTPPIVLLLNYMLQEIGQPMHAFDADAVTGNIRVAVSDVEEEIVALNGLSYRVPVGSVLIRDDVKTLAVGGVIGCANSMVTMATKRVLIESAAFDPIAIRKTAKGMGISTDASYLFERGSDREQVLNALRRLLFFIPHVDSSSVHLSYYPGQTWVPTKFVVDIKMMRTYLNLPHLTAADVRERLSMLGYTVLFQGNDQCEVTPPSWREYNVQTAMTVVEDFARIYGLNAIPPQLPPLDYELPPDHPYESLLYRLEPSLIGQGFCEVVTKSYYSHEAVASLCEVSPGIDARHVSVKNSVEKEYSFLKITNVIHLAKLAESNLRRHVTSIKVYECARVYDRALGSSSQYRLERDVFSMAVAGRWYDGEWKKGETMEENLFFLKGVLESLITAAGGTLIVGRSEEKLLHPHAQGSLMVHGHNCGFFGLIHPKLRERLALDEPLLYAEIDLSVLMRACTQGRLQQMFSEYPPITRDLTLKVPAGTPAGMVVETLYSQQHDLLKQVQIIDSFQRSGEPFHRITYRLRFQNDARTLEREEVDTCMERAIAILPFERVT
jgi:phenylalanyl-tRNA synthetase beta chain